MAAVILAAGSSSRLGEPKQLVMLAGERLLERAVRVAAEARCSPIVVVLGASAQRIEAACALGSARLVENADWASGMASSVRAGVEALAVKGEGLNLRVESGELGAESFDGVILMTCDQPAVTTSHLRRLMESDEPMASSYAGRRGVPAYFPRESFAALLVLEGDAGARVLLKDAPTVELGGGELDIDTQATLDAARALYE